MAGLFVFMEAIAESKNTERLVSSTRLIEILGTSRAYIDFLIKRGCPHYKLKDRLVFFLPSVIQFIHANQLQKGSPGGPPKPNDTLAGPILGFKRLSVDEAMVLADQASTLGHNDPTDSTPLEWGDMIRSEQVSRVKSIIRCQISDHMPKTGGIRNPQTRKRMAFDMACEAVKAKFPHMEEVVEENYFDFCRILVGEDP